VAASALACRSATVGCSCKSEDVGRRRIPAGCRARRRPRARAWRSVRRRSVRPSQGQETGPAKAWSMHGRPRRRGPDRRRLGLPRRVHGRHSPRGQHPPRCESFRSCSPSHRDGPTARAVASKVTEGAGRSTAGRADVARSPDVQSRMAVRTTRPRTRVHERPARATARVCTTQTSIGSPRRPAQRSDPRWRYRSGARGGQRTLDRSRAPPLAQRG